MRCSQSGREDFRNSSDPEITIVKEVSYLLILIMFFNINRETKMYCYCTECHGEGSVM